MSLGEEQASPGLAAARTALAGATEHSANKVAAQASWKCRKKFIVFNIDLSVHPSEQ